ncbi:anti-sigma regulatory factor (Ser/Thr protein kinase) [Streptosporangium album]|uniref:Anti-sigma regulatory factor (Ser/Thr protein kinase) n=1 Tax=Streptosporangium album TaxID=47479 RepID=A0A7W7RYV8_9ACTN|nr:ATP-binding protein [Streptosporangium album]MBB4940791.1 anti-sigma regulatory factor (Ser/Thr protein kinase) [Streptosporangium album]
MYEQSLPGAPASIRGAQEWIRSVASAHHPSLTKDAGEVIGELMAIAIRRTPKDGTIHLKATTSDEGLKVEIQDPGQAFEPTGTEWAQVSTLVWSARSSGNAGGHLTEVEIRAQQATPA